MGADDFRAVVGANVARHRRAMGRSQAQVAFDLGIRGIVWTRATVAQVETGRRTVDLAEAIALADVLRAPLAELARAEAPVRVGDGTWHADFARAVAAGEELPVPPYTSPATDLLLRVVPAGLRAYNNATARFRAWWPTLRTARQVEAAMLAGGASERATAERLEAKLRLGITAPDVAAAARRRWGRSLDDERDRRVAERSTTTDRRSRQALRGLVSRQLDREIAEEIEGAADRAEARMREEHQ